MGYYRGNRPQKDQPDLFTEFKSYRADVEEFFKTWNSFIWLPKISASDRQCAVIRDALLRPFFERNWRASFGIMAKSPFLRKMRPRFSFDWYIIPDNFDKIIEGKYLDEKYQQTENQTSKDGDEEFIL